MSKPKYWDVWRAFRDSKHQFTKDDLEAALQRSVLSNLQYVPADATYLGASRDAWELGLAYTGVDLKRYIVDAFDCDNFAVLFAGLIADKFGINGVGIVVDYSGGHAYCAILIVEDGKLSLGIIEPQNDQFIIKTEGMYSARFGFILFT